MSKEKEFPSHISSCVPFYDLIYKHVRLKAEDRKQPETTMSLVAGYAFANYSTVTTEADGWFGHPDAVYMGISEARDKETISTVPVLDRTLDNPKYALSLCLAPMYGKESKWLMLAELIEHYKLQGVEHFYLYIKDIDSYSRRIIDDYVKTGEAEAIFFRKKQDRPGKEWQLVGVQTN
ncbi:hypothetical protein OESDEN_01014 [Oesophagostomum dentatum]|uniref:Glycosyltransferase family 92 protein n=1 Tax=Oesophagostomum dentatum TaxID=61180 RepID=A0A0B1TP11_OESDE|nr:hypothetical protein OESDEN_01014 [Oesophagostomum dentatum]